MPNLHELTIRLAYANTNLRPHLLAALKQGAEFTLYDRYLAWADKFNRYPLSSPHLRMNRLEAENYSPRTFQVLESLWLKDVDTEAKLHSWASRIKNPNVAMSLAYTAHKLVNASVTRYDNEYFFTNWKSRAAQFMAFGGLVEKACEARFWEIVGRDSRVKPATPPAIRRTFTPPPIPSDLPKTVEDWQLYDIPGAGQAVLSLKTTLSSILTKAGQDILPTNTDIDNQKKVSVLISRMRDALEAHSAWGAMDGDSADVAQEVLERYLSQYLDKFDFPKTFNALYHFR